VRGLEFRGDQRHVGGLGCSGGGSWGGGEEAESAVGWTQKGEDRGGARAFMTQAARGGHSRNERRAEIKGGVSLRRGEGGRRTDRKGGRGERERERKEAEEGKGVKEKREGRMGRRGRREEGK